jgi:actin-like ATPase involved in cell morphogenesis
MTAKSNNDKHDIEATTGAPDLDNQGRDYKKKKSDNSDPNAIGVDIGTSKIVFAQKKNGEIKYDSNRNAFISVEYSSFTEKILNQNQIRYHLFDNSLVVYGDGAEVFADMLNTEARRPMRKGLLNADETHSIDIIKKIIDDLVDSAKSSQAKLIFSVPDAPKDSPTDIIYHEALLKRHLEKKGFTTNSINEGLAVVFSELEDENFTGLGISAGGGMCNVCLAYLSVPLVSFCINKGGDYLDDAAASVTGMVNTRVRSFKENGFNLGTPPRNKVEDALQVYHDDLITTLVRTLKTSIQSASSTLNVDRPIPIVLSGGTAKVNGFKDRFEKIMKEENIPLEFGKIRIAKDPLTATAKGALIAAMN